MLRQIKPLMRPDARLVWATKGLEAETGRLLQDVAREALGDQIPLAVISGPTFALRFPRFLLKESEAKILLHFIIMSRIASSLADQ